MSAFAGRGRELEELERGLEDALRGHGRLFLIRGSSPADELAAVVGPVAEMLVGACREGGGAPPYWPWTQVLQARVRGRDPALLRAELGAGAPDLAQIVPELYELFPDLRSPPLLDFEAARFRLFDSVASFLRYTAEEAPLVIVLEDLHAADEPSLLLLQFIARDLERRRLLLVGTFRGHDPAPDQLSALAQEPTTTTLTSPEASQPQIGRSAKPRDVLSVDPHLAGDRAAALLAPEEAARHYETALSLAADADRPQLLLKLCRSLWLTGKASAERTVESRDGLLAAGDRTGAAEAELLLANIARNVGDRASLAEHMQRASELVRSEPPSRTKAEVLTQASRLHMLAGEDEEAIETARQGLLIAEQLGLESLRADCLNNLGTARVRSGNLEGIRDLERAVAVAAGARDGWEEGRAHRNLAECALWHSGTATRAFAEREEARRLAELTGPGPYARWLRFEQAQEWYWRGRWNEALSASEELTADVEGGGSHDVASGAQTLLALIRLSRGAAEEALAHAREAVRLAGQTQGALDLRPAVAHNAWVAADLGRADEADRLLDELLEPGGAEPDPNDVVPLSLAALLRGREGEVLKRIEGMDHRSPWHEAATAMLLGNYVEAADAFARIGVQPEEAYARLLAAEALAASGEQGDAEVQLRRCLSFFEQVDATAYLRRGRDLLSGASGLILTGYRIEGEIGRGGMGVVYRAIDLHLERPVALKLIAPELASDEGFRERFLAESKLAASLGHPHVLPVHAAGEAEGQLYLSMRYVEGEDLKELLGREGSLEPGRAFRICRQVAEALDAAHRRGLVHRDVKPANVLLDEGGEAYLADFGLTKPAGNAPTQTGGQIAGTLDYLAPEQIRGEELDGRTDQYALACVLYECLAGTPPFRRRTEAEVLWAHMQDSAPPLPERPALDPVFRRGLAKEKGDRFPRCVDLVDSARESLGFETPRLRRHRRLLKRSRVLLVAGAVILAGAIAAAVTQFTGDGGGGLANIGPNSVAVVDPKTNRVVNAIAVGRSPSSVAVGAGAVWVLNADDRTVSRIALATGSARTISTGGTPTDLAVGAGALWVVDGFRGEVSRIDLSSGVAERTLRLPRVGVRHGDLRRSSVASADGSVWVSIWDVDAARFPGSVWRIDPVRERVAATLRQGGGDVAVGEGAAWVAGPRAFLRIDLQSNAVTTVEAPTVPGREIATGAGAVWVTNTVEGTLSKVEPRSEKAQRTITVGESPRGVAVGHGSVWVANTGDGTVVRIDPMTTRIVRTIRLGRRPVGVAVGRNAVWVTVD